MRSFLVLSLFLIIAAPASSVPYANSVAEFSNRLASDLHKKLSVGDNNVFVSPLSISTALAMLFYGTRGRTADEIRHALGYQEAGLTDDQVHEAFRNILKKFSEHSTSKNFTLSLANAVLIQERYPILNNYITGLQEIYQATVRNVDFATQTEKTIQEVNDWVKQKTNNQISKLLNNLDPGMVMVLLNAVYFKGTWKTKFERTVDGTFFNYGLETGRVSTPMMYYEKEDVLYTRIQSAQAVELPYEGDDLSMIVMLPDALDGLPQLERNLTPNTIKDIRKSIRKTSAVLGLPKFKMEYEKGLNSVLQDLGLRNVFESSADLSGISEAQRLVVSKILHKAVVEVNEEGTEASGATGVIIRPVSASVNDVRFVADHPFLFFIICRVNGLVLFQGRVNKL